MSRARSRWGGAAALSIAASLLAVTAGGATPASGATAPRVAAAPVPAPARVAAPTARLAWRARVVAAAPVREAPREGSPARGTVSPTGAWNGGSVYLLVLGVAQDADGQQWLRVALPSRPNGRAGWVLAARLEVSPVRWRVVIDRARRTASAYRDGRLIRHWRVVVGTGGTPTPTGLFAVYERVRQAPGSELGPWALHLTAHSDTLRDYGGGPGRVALHGRAGALLDDPLGSAASHGCVRMDNAVIAWLAARVGPGTPVRVR